MLKSKNNWFVVMSKPNQESKAITNLKNQDFDVFSPYFEKENFIGKTLKTKEISISFIHFCETKFRKP